MTTPWYDTRKGIEDALEKGLPGLEELRKERSQAGYKRKERMDTWIVLGLFWLDTCGNFSKMDKAGAPFYRRRAVEVPKIMTTEEFKTLYPGVMMSANMGSCVPPIVDKCDRCGGGWSLRENVEDFYTFRNREDVWINRHESCHTLKIIEDEQVFFKRVLERSEMPYESMRMIPNGYYNDPTYFGPWFIVKTEWGDITIGWRKRVINIDWSGTQINHNGDITFKDQDVTKGRTMIHAWGEDKCVEYLRTLSQGNFTKGKAADAP